jgi:hypothetical protein
MFSGRAVLIFRGITTRRHSYSASLNQDTSLSEITQALYAVREARDRASVTVSWWHFTNHLTKIMVAGQRQIRMPTRSVSQVKV